MAKDARRPKGEDETPDERPEQDTPEERRAKFLELMELPPEERAMTQILAAEALMRAASEPGKGKGKGKGKKNELWDRGIEMELAALAAKTGALRDTHESSLERVADKPAELVRPDAQKMEGHADDEELGLRLLGRGHGVTWMPLSQTPLGRIHVPLLGHVFGPRHDFSYGVYCNTDQLEELMGEYAGTPPLDVLTKARFYQDALLHAPQLELTVMAVALRDLDLGRLHRKCAKSFLGAVAGGIPFLEDATEEEPAHEERVMPATDDLDDAEKVAAMLAPGTFAGLELASEDGRKLLRGTHVLLTTTPKGGLTVEAITPGTLRDREQFLIANLPSHHVAYRVLDAFLGPSAFDPLARFDIGAALLFFANGFKATLGDGGAGRFSPSWDMMLRRHELFDDADATVRSPAAAAAAAEAAADWRPKWWPFKRPAAHSHQSEDESGAADARAADVDALNEAGAADRASDDSEVQAAEGVAAAAAENAPRTAPPPALASLTLRGAGPFGSWGARPGAGRLFIGRRRQR